MGVGVKSRDVWEGKIIRIQKICCEEFRVSLIDFLSERRCRDYVTPRHIAMWMCRRYTIASFPVIGRMFRKHHTSIINGVNTADRLIASKEAVKDLAYKCCNRFEEEDKKYVHGKPEKA